MTISSVQLLLGFGSLLLAIVAHTAALFYWGGKTKQLLEIHSEELRLLRTWKHDDVTQDLTDLKLRVGMLEATLREREP